VFAGAVVFACTVVAVAGADAPPASGVATTKCNGRAALCDRALGEVAFATTHNSMSSPEDHFVGPNQGTTIAAQLRAGIRGFQIDAYEGVARKGRVYTDHSVPFESHTTDLSPALVATASRIHRQLGAPPPGTPTEVYLCHSFCEIGAVRMDAIARQIRAFLDRNRREVLVFVVEDYVAPERLRAVFDDTGLAHELLAVSPGAPLPTLGQMIHADTRILVMLENGDGGPQLPNAFRGLVEETPFTFLTTSGLKAPASCDPNRGPASAPVFQLNHWVTPPTRNRARAVNYPVLRRRVRQCTHQRGRVPTLVAVDFAEHSDVLRVVDELNGA
jgi:hypothetical protein